VVTETADQAKSIASDTWLTSPLIRAGHEVEVVPLVAVGVGVVVTMRQRPLAFALHLQHLELLQQRAQATARVIAEKTGLSWQSLPLATIS